LNQAVFQNVSAAAFPLFSYIFPRIKVIACFYFSDDFNQVKLVGGQITIQAEVPCFTFS